jgi:hypothetical protein
MFWLFPIYTLLFVAIVARRFRYKSLRRSGYSSRFAHDFYFLKPETCTRVRLWNRALHASEIAGLYTADAAPRVGLVAEFLLNSDTGTAAFDTAQGNHGGIVNATWAAQA